MLLKMGWGNVIQIFDSIANNIHSRKICLHDIKFLALEKKFPEYDSFWGEI